MAPGDRGHNTKDMAHRNRILFVFELADVWVEAIPEDYTGHGYNVIVRPYDGSDYRYFDNMTGLTKHQLAEYCYNKWKEQKDWYKE